MSAAADLEVRRGNSLARADELSVEDLVHQVAKIQQAMSAVMKEDEHYGVIPGTGAKPSLLKPGAEKLCLLFRFDPEYETTERWDGDHLVVTAKCTLYHIPTGNRVASGMGLCSTRESKYAYRNAKRKCPVCNTEAIIKGKQEYGGGWVCFKKQDGCGAKFPDGDDRIEKQTVGRVANPDLPDQYNTVVKMAAKRALIAATLNGTAASDLFTQDLEDLQIPAEPAADGIEDAELVADPDGTLFPDQQPFQQPDTPRGSASGDVTKGQRQILDRLKTKLIEQGQPEEGIQNAIDAASNKAAAIELISRLKKLAGEAD